MAETMQQYIARLTGHSKGKDPLKMMGAASARLEKLLKPIPAKALRKPPAPGKWSIADILSHLAEDEIALSWRVRLVLSEKGAKLQGFNQDKWVENAGYLQRDPKGALELFRVLRANNIAFLRSIPKIKWMDHGIHSERGKETIDRMVRMMAGHDLSHMKQIEGILKGSKG